MKQFWMAHCLVAVLAIPCIGAGEGEQTDSLEILKKADAACKAVKAVRYESTFQGVGANSDRFPNVTGTYLCAGDADLMGISEKFLIDIKLQHPDTDEVEHKTGGGNGETYFLIDHDTRKAYQDTGIRALGSQGRALMAGLLGEYLNDAPFYDEIYKSTSRSLVGSRNIGGVDCYELQLTYDQGSDVTWYIAKADFLPRGRINISTVSKESSAGWQRMISKLEVDPKIDSDTFQLKLPEGYEKVEGAAP